jgi:hypothetical protein
MRKSFVKGVVLGAVVSAGALMSTSAFAGTGVGSLFNLGQTNTVNGVTALSGSTNGTQLHIENTNRGKSAAGLGIKVATDRPPLIVNSTAKVEHLNADFVDGRDANAFQRATKAHCDFGRGIAEIEPDGKTSCTTSAGIPISTLEGIGGADRMIMDPAPLAIDLFCHAGTNSTAIEFENQAGSTGSLNWIFSKGGSPSFVNAGGVALTSLSQPGSVQFFDFSGARIEGQFIFTAPGFEVTVTVHTFDAGTACEYRGIAEVSES